MRTERRLKNTVPFKKFLAWYIKWLGIAFGCVSAYLVIALMVMLFVGEANHQQTKKVNLIMNNEYIEPDFQDSWKRKKASAGTLTKKKYFQIDYNTYFHKIEGEQMEDVYLNDDLLDSKLQNVLYANKVIGQIRMKNDSYEVYLYEPQIRKTRVKTYKEVEEILKNVSKSLKEQNQK